MTSTFKIFSLICCAVLLLGIMPAFKLDPKNPPTGQTGAPNETTCSTATGCHFGGTFTGSAALIGLPDTIAANTEYNLSVKLSSTCNRTGFELTVLDKSNKKCGALTVGTNCSIKLANAKEYIRQSNPVTLAGGSATYSFKWKSPATITGDSAFFYFVMLQANGNGNTSGDNVAKGIKKAVMKATSSTSTTSINPEIQLYPNPTSDYLTVSIKEDGNYVVNIINQEGRMVNTFKTTSSKVMDVKNLASGNYYVQVTSKNGIATKSIVIRH